MADKKGKKSETIAVFASPEIQTKRGGDEAAWTEAQKTSLLKSFESVSSTFEEMLDKNKFETSAYKMSKIEVKLGVSAKGKVGILGTGAEASADASLTVTFEQRMGK
ncbi:hypothetical protein [uncultured Ruegeria sp.]|uniref:Pepco domain-containing protein n=1 Tax=uncultured Ruegeria sp. TaxID=259304 RepID=UPI0026061DDE|nr:hypothetical protein [uncultured Ruegeria sp.]